MAVMVIYSTQMERTKEFLTEMGLCFLEEKHGDGPTHYACEVGDYVLEIYPAKANAAIKFLDEGFGHERYK